MTTQEKKDAALDLNFLTGYLGAATTAVRSGDAAALRACLRTLAEEAEELAKSLED